MNDENPTITDEEREAAKRLSESFAASKRTLNGASLPKITQAGMTILSLVGCRFVTGFDKSVLAALESGNVLAVSLDVLQWAEVCRGSREQIKSWLNTPEAFRNHCEDIMLDGDMDLDATTQAFADVFAAWQEINGARVEVKEQNTAATKGAKTTKKKARSRAKPRNTRSR